MGRYYRVFAEAKVKEKWVNLNPYIVDLGGKVMETVRNIIIDNLDKKEKFYGVDIEQYISEGKL